MALSGKRTSWTVALLVWGAVSWLALSPVHHPILVSLSQDHGIELTDIPAVVALAVAVAIVGSRLKARSDARRSGQT